MKKETSLRGNFFKVGRLKKGTFWREGRTFNKWTFIRVGPPPETDLSERDLLSLNLEMADMMAPAAQDREWWCTMMSALCDAFGPI